MSRKIITLLFFTTLILIGIYYYFPKPTPLTINQVALNSQYDVVVAGAGTGGIASAIAAARLGSKVLLVEETDLIGGQIGAAGVTSTDIGSWQWNSGLSAEYTNRVKAHYSQKGLSVGTCYFTPDSVCPEPLVARQILGEMLAAEPNLTLTLSTRITKVNKSGTQITGVELNNQTTINTNLLIDATEYGDILPLAGADYRLGNTTQTSLNDNTCIQDITYLAVIKKYPSGTPPELQFKSPPPGYNDAVKQKFAAIVTNNGSTSFGNQYPFAVSVHNSYRGMPNSSLPGSALTKTGVNWANDYAIPNARAYLEDPTSRKTINCEAKLHTLQFLYYFQHDLGNTDWSVANDEGYDTPYNREGSCPNIPPELKAIEQQLPIIPYVRESRRLIGLTTVTAKNIYRTNTPARSKTLYPTSIAIGDYHTDLHSCNHASVLETGFETPSDNSHVGPFQIPIEVLISQNVDGLIAAEKNISVSRLVNGATRLQPITMATGQAAGTLASLAATHHIKPRDVSPVAVQNALLTGKSILYPAFDVNPTHPNFRQIQLSLLRSQILPISEINFMPDQKASKTELAIALNRAKYGNGYVPTSRTVRYTDVPAELWSAPWINQLAIDGVALPCDTNRYCPDKLVNRAELAIMLGRAKYGPTPPTYTTSVFSDLPLTNPAGPWAQKLYTENITSGCSTQPLNFCPNNELTRTQLAIFLANAFPPSVTQSNAPPTSPTPSPVITPSPTTKPGDFNTDGYVNLFDFNLLVSHFGNPYTLFDFNTLIVNYNR